MESLATAVVERVGVAHIITELADTLFAKIEACEAFSRGSEKADGFFLATSLPLANAVVHRAPGGSLVNAIAWAHNRWPDEADPVVRLATWTLVYIVNDGWKRYSKIDEKRPLWEDILAHVASLAEEPTSATAA